MESTNYYSQRDMLIEKIECYIIEKGLKVGDKLPSERVLCSMWGCNHVTLRSALKRLTIEGKIKSEENVGTFIIDGKIERYLQDFYSFSNFIKVKGMSINDKLISLRHLKCNENLSSKLQVPLESDILEIQRLRIVDLVPISIERAYLSLIRFKNLDDFNFSTESLYSILETNYKVELEGGKEEISITYATELEATCLQIEEDSPLFFIKQVTWNKNKEPVEYVESVIRHDKMRFSSVLKKQ